MIKRLLIAVLMSCAANAYSLGSTPPQNATGQTLNPANVSVTNSLTVSGPGLAPPATFSPSLSSGAVSAALSGTFLNSGDTTCVTGSTITVTIPANSSGSALVIFTGSASNSLLGGNIWAGIMVDGLLVNGETAVKGLVTAKEQVATDNNNMSFSTVVSALAAGQHSICLYMSVGTGTGTIDSTNSVATLSAYLLP